MPDPAPTDAGCRPASPLDLRALERLEADGLAAFVSGARWFAGRTHRLQSLRFVDATVPGAGGLPAGMCLAILEVAYSDAATERYSLPLALAGDEPTGAIVGQIEGVGTVSDGLAQPALGRALLVAIARNDNLATERGASIAARATRQLATIAPDVEGLTVRANPVEQSHSLLRCGDSLGLKVYRRLAPGTNLDLEIGRFLTEDAQFPHTAPIGGWIEYAPADPGEEPTTLALLEGWIANTGTGWDRALEIRRKGLAEGDPGGDAALLGRRTGQMHLALASRPDRERFAPVPLTRGDLVRWHGDAVGQIDRSLDLLQNELGSLAPELAETARALLTRREALRDRLEPLRTAEPSGQLIRIHGDYHLGQTLRTTDNDYVLLDFEGEPLRPLAERRRPGSPWKDVAGMIRSFDYAWNAVPDAVSEPRSESCFSITAFLDAYQSTTSGASFRMDDPAAERTVMRAFLLEKAAYELQYELSHRPDWVFIPLGGLHQAATRSDPLV